MEMEFKELEEMAVKEAKEAFLNNWFIDNSDDLTPSPWLKSGSSIV